MQQHSLLSHIFYILYQTAQDMEIQICFNSMIQLSVHFILHVKISSNQF